MERERKRDTYAHMPYSLKERENKDYSGNVHQLSYWLACMRNPTPLPQLLGIYRHK